MDYESLPIVCMGTATRIYSYGMVRTVNFGANTRFVMFDLQFMDGKYCRVPNLVLDVPTLTVPKSMKMTEAAFRSRGIALASDFRLELVT